MQPTNSLDYVHLFTTFSSRETAILLNFLQKNSIPDLEPDEITDIGHWIKSIRASFNRTEDKRHIKLDRDVISNYKFYKVIMRELELRSEAETVTEEEIEFFDKLFQVFDYKYQVLESSGLQYPII